MCSVNGIKAAQQALEDAMARPLDSFYTAEESFFDDAPKTREAAKAELIAAREMGLKREFANASNQKVKDAYIAEHGLEATVI